jgi:NAD dependent epimerase/dehydratase family enzyme
MRKAVRGGGGMSSVCVLVEVYLGFECGRGREWESHVHVHLGGVDSVSMC